MPEPGFINFADFRHNQIDRSPEEVLAFVNIAACGIPNNLMGELEDLRMARPKETLDVLLENRDIALGVKIRVGTMTRANSAKALEYAAGSRPLRQASAHGAYWVGRRHGRGTSPAKARRYFDPLLSKPRQKYCGAES